MANQETAPALRAALKADVKDILNSYDANPINIESLESTYNKLNREKHEQNLNVRISHIKYRLEIASIRSRLNEIERTLDELEEQ